MKFGIDNSSPGEELRIVFIVISWNVRRTKLFMFIAPSDRKIDN